MKNLVLNLGLALSMIPVASFAGSGGEGTGGGFKYTNVRHILDDIRLEAWNASNDYKQRIEIVERPKLKIYRKNCKGDREEALVKVVKSEGVFYGKEHPIYTVLLTHGFYEKYSVPLSLYERYLFASSDSEEAWNVILAAIKEQRTGKIDCSIPGYWALSNFADVQSASLELELVAKDLADGIESLHASHFKHFDHPVDKKALAKYVRNVRFEPSVYKQRRNQDGRFEELLFDYRSHANGTKEIVALSSYFAQADKGLNHNENEMMRLLLHEAAHLFFVGKTVEETEEFAADLALTIMEYLRSLKIQCNTDKSRSKGNDVFTFDRRTGRIGYNGEGSKRMTGPMHLGVSREGVSLQSHVAFHKSEWAFFIHWNANRNGLLKKPGMQGMESVHMKCQIIHPL